LLKGIAATDGNVCLVFSLVTCLLNKFMEDISDQDELQGLIDWSAEIKKKVYDTKNPPSMKNRFDIMPSDNDIVKFILETIERTAADMGIALKYKPSQHRMNILFVDDRIFHSKVAVVSPNPDVDSDAHNFWIRNTKNHFYPLRPVAAEAKLQSFHAAKDAKIKNELIDAQADAVQHLLEGNVESVKRELKRNEGLFQEFQQILSMSPAQRSERLAALAGRLPSSPV